MSPRWQSRNVPYWRLESACYSAIAGEAETGNAGEQPDRGIAGRNSSRTMSRARSSSRRVLYRASGADQREAAPPLGFEMFWFCFLVLNSIGPIDSAMPGKRKRTALV